MTETAGAENVIPQGENANEVEAAQTPADNPAWSDFLSAIPQSMHDLVKPHLRKWDDGVNSRIQQVHEGYADFKPFKEAGLTRDILEQAYGIYEAVNNDPRRVYDILAETYGYNANTPQPNPLQGQQPNAQQQGQQGGELSAEYDIGQGGQLNPEIARLQQMVETMGNILIAQNEAANNAKADAALDAELAGARAKHGEFDERFVLAYMQNGMSADQAAQLYAEHRNQILAGHNRPTAPNVISGSGPLPSQQINPAKLDKKDTVALVANMMKAVNQQGV